MRVLTVDIGNTAVKGSVFEDGNYLASTLLEVHDATLMLPFIEKYTPEGGIVCAVSPEAPQFAAELERVSGLKLMILNHETPLPIGVDYGTPGTLGLDRIAAAAGAVRQCGSALVVDAGTAITLDLVANGRFLGGNISPGLRLRFRSLNAFTSSLPQVALEGELPQFGFDTATAIRSGVVRGVISDILFAYEEAKKVIPSPALLLTGGDAQYLRPLLEESGGEPTVVPSLVGLGLESIYLYNKDKNR